MTASEELQTLVFTLHFKNLLDQWYSAAYRHLQLPSTKRTSFTSVLLSEAYKPICSSIGGCFKVGMTSNHKNTGQVTH